MRCDVSIVTDNLLCENIKATQKDITVKGSGITGINAGYNKANGEVKENAETHVASTITAKDTLTTKSGQDTNIIGSKLEGETIKMEVGKDLNIESLQDKETYDEKNNSSGFNFSVDVSQPKGKPATYENAGITGGKNKGNTNSNYESVTDQAGIYAGKGGFDIEVGKNTDLKGAVIASEADASKNKLSTDTLTYSDIENKAEYEASNGGFNFDSKGEIPIAPKQGMPVNGEAESTTKSAIAEGTIEIRSNENQNISNLSRNTQEALNKLEKIFDAKTVKEQQELADLFGEVAFKAVGDIADRNWKNAKTPEEKAKWAEGGEYKILLHTFLGGMMSEFAGNGFKSGAISEGISQALQTQLSKIEDKGLRLIAGGLVAGTVNKVLGLKPEVGSSIAISGMKNNDYCHRTNSPEEIVFVEGEGFFKVDFWNGDEYQNDWYPEAGKVYWFQNPNDQSLGWEFVVGSGVLGDVYKDDTYINSWKNGYAYDKDENQIFINGKAIYNLKIFNLSDEETDGILDDVIGMYSGIKITRGVWVKVATVSSESIVTAKDIIGGYKGDVTHIINGSRATTSGHAWEVLFDGVKPSFEKIEPYIANVIENGTITQTQTLPNGGTIVYKTLNIKGSEVWTKEFVQNGVSRLSDAGVNNW